jgi:hypothetical protein
MKCQPEKKPVADRSNTIVSSHRLSSTVPSRHPSDQMDENGAMLEVRKLLSLMLCHPTYKTEEEAKRNLIGCPSASCSGLRSSARGAQSSAISARAR